MTEKLIICAVSVILGIFLGNGIVFFFNKMPGKWLVNYGEEPSDELLHPTHQRIKSTPWKYVFTGFFICLGIYLGISDPYLAIPSVFMMWLLVEMSISDILYMIVPDQLIILLIICAFGFIPYYSDIKFMGYGLVAGFGIEFIVYLISKLVYKRPMVGGADIKLFAVLGLIFGLWGILEVFVLTTFISAGHFIYLMIRKKATLKDQRPMVPYIAISSFVLLILHIWQ